MERIKTWSRHDDQRTAWYRGFKNAETDSQRANRVNREWPAYQEDGYPFNPGYRGSNWRNA